MTENDCLFSKDLNWTSTILPGLRFFPLNITTSLRPNVWTRLASQSKCGLVSVLVAAFPLDHLALRGTPALQEETNKARQRAEESRQNEEDSNSLAHIQHGQKHNSADHHGNSTDSNSVCIRKMKQSAIPG
jgi:hypothetical protein